MFSICLNLFHNTMLVLICVFIFQLKCIDLEKKKTKNVTFLLFLQDRQATAQAHANTSVIQEPDGKESQHTPQGVHYTRLLSTGAIGQVWYCKEVVMPTWRYVKRKGRRERKEKEGISWSRIVYAIYPFCYQIVLLDLRLFEIYSE